MTGLSQARKLEIVENLVGKELAAFVAYQVSRAADTDVVDKEVLKPELCLQNQFYLLLLDKLIDGNPFNVASDD